MRQCRLACRLLAIGAFTLGAAVVQAQAVYRWVDDAGRTHFGDQVPEKYRARATRVDPAVVEPTPEDRRAAEERAEREKQQLDASRRAPALAVLPPAVSASAPPVKRPPVGVTPGTDCATWRRLYEESQQCFGPFRTATGGLKAEAYEHCTEIPNPDPTCGRTVREATPRHPEPRR
jgi:hypothetical protein